MGKLIQQKQEAGELATQKIHGKGIQTSVLSKDTRLTLPEIGITRKESSTSKKLAAIPEELFFKFDNNILAQVNFLPLNISALLAFRL